MMRSIVVVCMVLLLAACSAEKKQEQAMKDMKVPINCDTAEGDLRALKAEKANTEQRIGEGVTAIVPVGALIGLIRGTEGTQIKVAIGDYNKMIDERIADIKATCGL